MRLAVSRTAGAIAAPFLVLACTIDLVDLADEVERDPHVTVSSRTVTSTETGLSSVRLLVLLDPGIGADGVRRSVVPSDRLTVNGQEFESTSSDSLTVWRIDLDSSDLQGDSISIQPPRVAALDSSPTLVIPFRMNVAPASSPVELSAGEDFEVTAELPGPLAEPIDWSLGLQSSEVGSDFHLVLSGTGAWPPALVVPHTTMPATAHSLIGKLSVRGRVDLPGVVEPWTTADAVSEMVVTWSISRD